MIETSNLGKNNGVSSFLLVNLGKSNNSLAFFTLANSKIDQIAFFFEWIDPIEQVLIFKNYTFRK